MVRPIVTENSELGALGVRIVDGIVHDKLHYIFRPRERLDLGIDGEIEIVDEQDDKRRGTGRLIAVQIKCGESYFQEGDDDAYVYRGERKHLEYWSDFSLPVLVMLCHPKTREAYWAEFSPGAATILDSGWKMRIPKQNRLAAAALHLDQIARRNHLFNVIELAVRGWVHAVHAERVEFCGYFEMPRDYGGYRDLMKVGDETVMLHWLYARYGSFEAQEVREALEALPGNLMYSPKLMLCFVAETVESLRLAPDITTLISSEPAVEVRRLLFKRGEAVIGEVDAEDNIDLEYYAGKPVYRENAQGRWIS
jgi:hypothetical protein